MRGKHSNLNLKMGRTNLMTPAVLLLAICAIPVSAFAQVAPPDGVEATATPLLAPSGLVYDAAGNLYIAALNDHVIRRVDLKGIITTVAGTGVQGFAGDGGAATSAQLDSPAGIAIDSDGNLYIADTSNNRIREVAAATGVISTIAGTGAVGYSGDGGAAASATLNGPAALAVDAGANLYIADAGNHVIRKIAGTTMTTVAGTGVEGFGGDGGQALLANLDTPGGLAVDSAGTLYIADTYNQRVRAISPAGVITTIAGTGASGFGGDGGPAAAALFDQPQGLALDGSGNLFVADSDNHRIREITADGNINTVVGDGAQGYSGDLGSALSSTLDTPNSVAVTAAGGIAVSDTSNDRIRMISVDDNINTVAGIAPAAVESLGISSTGSSAVYGTASISATFAYGSNTATGVVSFTDTTSGTVSLGSSALMSNVSTLALPTLGVGVHQIVASYAGDSSNAAVTSGVYVLAITPAVVIATATGVSQQYGLAIPSLTGSLAGVLEQDAANLTGVFSTTATSTSSPASYPISIALGGTAAANYTISLAADSGSFVVTKAASATTFTLSANTQAAGAPVVLTATAASTTTGVPTGNIVFSDSFNGTVTTIATSPLVNGSAQASLSTLAAGTHTLTATYSGDTNFTGSNGAAASPVTITSTADFTLAASTGSPGATQTILPGAAAVFSFTLQPQNGSFTSPIALSASGLPPGATIVFNPATITPGSTAASFTMTVQTSAATAQLHAGEIGSIAFALLLLPLAATRRMRQIRQRLGRALLLVFFSLAVACAITGCGGHSGFFGQTPKTYDITVTGTSTSATNTQIQHSATVALTVE